VQLCFVFLCLIGSGLNNYVLGLLREERRWVLVVPPGGGGSDFADLAAGDFAEAVVAADHAAGLKGQMGQIARGYLPPRSRSSLHLHHLNFQGREGGWWREELGLGCLRSITPELVGRISISLSSKVDV
jgi:hypothetical protein